MPARRGQTLVLFALTLLLLALMVMMTLSIGAKAKDKLDLQATADAAAYTNATATARTFNTAALLNRAAVSDWVAMAGIQALTAWGTLTGAYMETLGEMAYDFQEPVPGNWCWMQDGITGPPRYDASCQNAWLACGSGCPTDCSARTNETRDAAYEFWHAHYSLYSPAMRGDNVNTLCRNGTCSGTPFPRNRLGQLDKDVATQQRAVWRAVHNLAQLERNTYFELQTVLDQGRLSDEVVRAANGSSAGTGMPAGFTTHANAQAWRELTAWLNRNQSSTYNDAAVQATMGSVAKLFPTYFTAPPRQVDQFLAQIQSDLNVTHPGKFKFARGNGTFSGCAFLTKTASLSSPDDTTGAMNLLDTYCTGATGDSMLGWKAAAAVAADKVVMSYKDGCTGRWRSAPDGNGVDNRQVGLVVAAIVSPNNNSPASHVGAMDEFYAVGGFVGGCHGDHGYWNVIDPKEHQLGPYVDGDDDIVPGGLAYVFPSGNASPTGTDGQPKLPTLFARHYDNGAFASDPWDLAVRTGASAFQIGGRTLDGRAAVQGALSNGIAYYHRRGYWLEPANLLNPYWHATLVPADADRPDGRDQTAAQLQGAGFSDAAALYGMLRPTFKGVQ